MNGTRHALNNMTEQFERLQGARMEADSRLNNDAMKGEGTVRFTQMSALRCMYIICTRKQSNTKYTLSHQRANAFMH